MGILSTSTQSSNGDSAEPAEKADWRAAMRVAIRDVAELRERLQLPPDDREGTGQAASQFPVFVPLEYLARIESGNERDPLLMQVLPIADEHQTPSGYSLDPLEEQSVQPTAGLLHKYPGRALLVTTGTCPVHCRYCFRRHFAYDDLPQGRAAWQPALNQLAKSADLEEVLLSGGDPLALGDELLRWLVSELATITHLKRVRVHTRFPIMIPQRITGALTELLTATRLRPVIVVHANHANELNQPVVAALEQLVDAGIPVFNQSVLLRGVNDSVDALADLSRALINSRVTPYYLHLLDRVAGATHFEVPESEGRSLIGALRARLPGYAVPRLAREEPGRLSKTVLS